jgi:hypothetical protein
MYSVRSGDTLTAVDERHGLTVRKLAAITIYGTPVGFTQGNCWR